MPSSTQARSSGPVEIPCRTGLQSAMHAAESAAMMMGDKNSIYSSGICRVLYPSMPWLSSCRQYYLGENAAAEQRK